MYKLILTQEEVGLMVALVGRIKAVYEDEEINALVHRCRAADIENRTIRLKVVR